MPQVSRSQSPSEAVRARLKHPVIDGDSHILEYLPALNEYIAREAGADVAKRVTTAEEGRRHRWYRMSPEQRRAERVVRTPWWTAPAKNTLDRVTAMLPRLLYSRMDELGLDFAVLYPTAGIMPVANPDPDIRLGMCRAFNAYAADYFGEFSDRMTLAAVIPMHTPQEALAELDHAHQLGLKVALIPSYVSRPVAAAAAKCPELAHRMTWIDTFGIDSEFDYDPVWAKAIQLGMPLAVHSVAMGFTDRSSISVYMYNHIGHFAAAGEAVCKSLFFGGVTRRFPRLRVAVLEGGVVTGCRLYADLLARWHKRNASAVQDLNPSAIDADLALGLFERHGGRLGGRSQDEIRQALRFVAPEVPPEYRDDFAACAIRSPDDVRDLFIPHFYFGCEADERLNAVAFNRKLNPMNAQIKAILGTDLGHWDVENMRDTLAEAYELVEEGLMTEEDFRRFTFANQVELYAGTNRSFFKGTRVEGEVETLLGTTATVDAR